MISSTLWDNSSSQKLLFRLLTQGHEIYISSHILSEYQRVLKRDFGFSTEDIIRILEKVLLFSKLAEPEAVVDIVKRDPTDNRIIECALSCSADFIATYDRHLLEVVRYGGVKIAKPEAISKELGPIC